MLASFAAAFASAGAGLAAIWDHAGYNIGAGLLALLSPVLALRAWNLTRHRRLEGIQRSQLVLRLRQLPPVDLRIVAVSNAEAASFARQLRDAFVEARVARHRRVSGLAGAHRTDRPVSLGARHERAAALGPVPVAGARRIRAAGGEIGRRRQAPERQRARAAGGPAANGRVAGADRYFFRSSCTGLSG
jgi:hypothetical protein